MSEENANILPSGDQANEVNVFGTRLGNALPWEYHVCKPEDETMGPPRRGPWGETLTKTLPVSSSFTPTPLGTKLQMPDRYEGTA